MVTPTPQAPKRGDLLWITYLPTTGHEQGGRRPAIVLSHDLYNSKVGLCIACPVTSEVKGYPFEVSLPDGLPVHGVILADQVRSVDWRARGAELIGQCPPSTVAEVLSRIRALLE